MLSFISYAAVLPALLMRSAVAAPSPSASPADSNPFALPNPFTYTARGFNFTLSKYTGTLGSPSAFSENILECQFNFLLTVSQNASQTLKTQIPGAQYTCPKTDIVLNATNVPNIFGGAPSAIGKSLGRRGVSLTQTGSVSPQSAGAQFDFSYFDIANVLNGLNLGVLRFGEGQVPAFDFQVFGIIQQGAGQAVPIVSGQWA